MVIIMGIPILVMGDTGTGKTFSIKHLDPDDTLLIQRVKKPLPFRSSHWQNFDFHAGTGSIAHIPMWQNMIRAIQESHKFNKSIVVLDDFQYVMGIEFVCRASEKNYEKFIEIGQHAFQVIMSAMNTNTDQRFYFLSHSENEESGRIKVKTIGRMLDEKIVLEGLFTIVLRASVEMNRYYFNTTNSGMDTSKSPEGMFDHKIDNDLNFVDKTICEYYGIPNKQPSA